MEKNLNEVRAGGIFLACKAGFARAANLGIKSQSISGKVYIAHRGEYRDYIIRS